MSTLWRNTTPVSVWSFLTTQIKQHQPEQLSDELFLLMDELQARDGYVNILQNRCRIQARVFYGFYHF